MQKESWTWTTHRLTEPARLVRWGHFGTPVLLFPTAGGDWEEVERFGLIEALGRLIGDGRIKVYSLDAPMVRAWLLGTVSSQDCARFQDAYDAFVYEEALPRIREDCRDVRIEPVLAGASLGAFAAISGLCRHPDAFRAAIGLSGVYDLAKRFRGIPSEEVPAFAPIPYLESHPGPQLEQLQHRVVMLATGEGGYETPEESTRLANALRSHGVPCQLSLSGATHDHTWSAWREMLPRSLAEVL